jgi:hypothetical protein
MGSTQSIAPSQAIRPLERQTLGPGPYNLADAAFTVIPKGHLLTIGPEQAAHQSRIGVLELMVCTEGSMRGHKTPVGDAMADCWLPYINRLPTKQPGITLPLSGTAIPLGSLDDELAIAGIYNGNKTRKFTRRERTHPLRSTGAQQGRR